MGATNTRTKQPSAAERRRRAKQAEEDAIAAGELEAPAEGEQIKLEDGVAVFRVDQGGGNFGFVVQPIGDVRVTEIGDILRYGMRAHENALGGR